jgi:hypothetical protein
MMTVARNVGGEVWRTHATYRYLFDRSQEFKRAEFIK